MDDLSKIPSSVVTVPLGGTGAATLTGVLKGNGTSAVTAAAQLAVADGGTGVATITSGNVLVGQGASAVTSSPISIAGVPLIGAKCVNLTIQNTAGTGDTDLKDASTNAVYTVPANKIAIVGAGRTYNGNGATSLNFLDLKVSSTYYRLCATLTLNTGTGNALFTGFCIILNAGEGLALNADHNAQNAWIPVIECSSSVAIKSYRILALANGDNTLYTVPANKTAYPLPNSLVASGSNSNVISIVNSSGSSRNYYANIVTSGGSVATTNKMQAATAINDVTASNITLGCALAAGDFINVNTNSGTAGQVAWINVVEY